MWSERGLCVSPNGNLVSYAGYTEGTNTRRRAQWSELPLQSLPSRPSEVIEIDVSADAYLSRQVFRGTPTGVIRGAAESAAMAVLRRQR